MDGSIFCGQGKRIAVVIGPSIFDLNGQKLYDLKSTKIYKLSGVLVGHIPLDARSSDRRLDKSPNRKIQTPHSWNSASTSGLANSKEGVYERIQYADVEGKKATNRNDEAAGAQTEIHRSFANKGEEPSGPRLSFQRLSRLACGASRRQSATQLRLCGRYTTWP
jgi:hypothetical protein